MADMRTEVDEPTIVAVDVTVDESETIEEYLEEHEDYFTCNTPEQNQKDAQKSSQNNTRFAIQFIYSSIISVIISAHFNK